MSTARDLIDPTLRRQHQVISRNQVLSAGVAPATLSRMARSGELVLAERGIYRSGDAEPTWESRLLAVILSRRGLVVASHRAVARLLGVPSYDAADLEVSVPSKRGFAHPEAIVHESRDLHFVPPMEIAGIPCTPPRRLAVDIGSVLGTTAYTTVIRELRRDHGVTWKQLAAILRLHSEHGRDGCGPLRQQLERYYGVDGIPDTTLEQQVLDLIIDADLPVPVCQFVVPLPGGGHYRLDFAYPEWKLDVEVDGPHHRLPHVRARDARRDRRMKALGWDVLRLPEELVVYQPALVVPRVHRALAQRSAQLRSGATSLRSARPV